MALLEWSDKLSVNIDEIDAQHKKLIELINRLNDAWKEDFKREDVRSVFMELIEYTKYHFTSEEKYMEKINYPGLEAHKKQHAAFVNKLKNLQAKCSYNSREVYTDLLSFLSNWIVVHIMHSDQEYVPYMEGAK